jgi:hypothetical protein
MDTQYKSITKNDINRYKAISENLITKTQIANDYNTLRIIFIDNKTLPQYFQQEITQAINRCFQGKLPRQTHAYTSKQNRAAIAINTEFLKDKTDDYCEYLILEEFCHLLDYAAADFEESSQFLGFCNDYRANVGSELSTQICERLNSYYDHYYVNKLMLSFDAEKWIYFNSDNFGPNSHSALNRLFAEIRATKPANHSLAIITTEILRMLCFSRAIESFLAHAELPAEGQKQELITIQTNTIDTIQLAEQKARALDKTYPNTTEYFKPNDFVSKDSFFIRVSQFWDYIHLFE